MSTTYVARPRPRPRAWVSETELSWQDRPTMSVFVAERGDLDTGLVDATGMSIVRVVAQEPFGFVGRPKP